AMPLAAALRASVVTSENLGTAIAARMPKMEITTISSIRVNPDAFFIYSPQLRQKVEVEARILSPPLCRCKCDNRSFRGIYSITHLNGTVGRMNGCRREGGSSAGSRGWLRTTRNLIASGGPDSLER